jgi:integrase
VPDLTRKKIRESLAVRRDVHTMQLDKGAFLTWRRMTADGGTWGARCRTADGRQQFTTFDDVDRDDWSTAKKHAEAWCKKIAGAGSATVTRGTVRAWVAQYLRDLRNDGRRATARSTWLNILRLVLPKTEPFGHLLLEKVTKQDFRAWRDRVSKGRGRRTKQARAPRSVNRYVRPIRVALNRAIKEHDAVGNSDAWRVATLRDNTEDAGETQVFLTAAQRAAIIAAATPDCARFLRGLAATGARPIELSEARVSDLDGNLLRLATRKNNAGKLRVRQCPLDSTATAFFTAQTRGKLPSAYLFTDAGEQWSRNRWSWEIRKAVDAINEKARGADHVPHLASAYSFRHTRISELLQTAAVDALRVAVMTGTSVQMIEKHYFKFLPQAAVELLEKIREVA